MDDGQYKPTNPFKKPPLLSEEHYNHVKRFIGSPYSSYGEYCRLTCFAAFKEWHYEQCAIRDSLENKPSKKKPRRRTNTTSRKKK